MVASHLAKRAVAQPSSDVATYPQNPRAYVRLCPADGEQDLRVRAAAILPHVGPG